MNHYRVFFAGQTCYFVVFARTLKAAIRRGVTVAPRVRSYFTRANIGQVVQCFPDARPDAVVYAAGEV